MSLRTIIIQRWVSFFNPPIFKDDEEKTRMAMPELFIIKHVYYGLVGVIQA